MSNSTPTTLSPTNESNATNTTNETNPSTNAVDVLVQYIVMRGDLIKQHKWNVGGLISNGSHACVAVITEHIHDPHVIDYISPAAVTQMHKVVLSAKDESELVATSDLLTKNSIHHRLWIEEPEKLRTCLACKPYPRSIIQPLLRHLKLFR